MHARLAAAVAMSMCAACGDGVPAPDAAPPIDAEVGLVRVQYRGGVPSGNLVVFQDADSSVVLATNTDATGQANAYMRPGGYVTLAGHNGRSFLLYTWSGVQPGDTLELDRTSVSDSGLAEPHILTVPTALPTLAYRAYTSCGSFALAPQSIDGLQTASSTVDLHRCAGSTDVLVVAGVDGTPQSYFYADNVPLATTGVPLAGTYAPFDTSTVHLVTRRDGAAATVTQSLIDRGREVYRGPDIALTVDRSGGGGYTRAMPLPSAATLMTTARLSPTASALGAEHVVMWGPASASTTIDVDVPLRPYTSTPAYAASAHAVQWTEAHRGVLADAVLVQLYWFRPATSEEFQWQLIAPRGPEPSVPFPHLPQTTLEPTEQDVLVGPSVLANITLDGGYDRIRGKLLGLWANGAPWPIDGSSGSARYEQFDPAN